MKGGGVLSGEKVVPTIRRARSRVDSSSIGRSAATTAPARRTVTRSATLRTSSSLWLIRITVRPSTAICRSVRIRSSDSRGVSTAVGSSRIRTRAPRWSVFRISTRCCSPTDSCHTGREGSTPRWYRSPSSRACRMNVPAVSRNGTPGRPSRRFSATVWLGTSR